MTTPAEVEEGAAQDPPETAQDPAPPKQKQKPTEYHILQLVSSSGADETYKIVARNIKAVGNIAAIKNTVTPTEEPISYLAVPSRSIKLITVRLQTKQQTVIG